MSGGGGGVGPPPLTLAPGPAFIAAAGALHAVTSCSSSAVAPSTAASTRAFLSSARAHPGKQAAPSAAAPVLAAAVGVPAVPEKRRVAAEADMALHENRLGHGEWTSDAGAEASRYASILFEDAQAPPPPFDGDATAAAAAAAAAATADGADADAPSGAAVAAPRASIPPLAMTALASAAAAGQQDSSGSWPLVQADAAGAAAAPPPPGVARALAGMGATLRVLIVDDTPTNARMLGHLLRTIGVASTEMVHDGAAALRRVYAGATLNIDAALREMRAGVSSRLLQGGTGRRAATAGLGARARVLDALMEPLPGAAAAAPPQPTVLYDVICLDRSMPIMNGFEACVCFRALGYTRPIIGISGDVMAAEEAAFASAGLSAFLSKPITKALLVDTLQRVLGAPAAATPLSSAAAAQ